MGKYELREMDRANHRDLRRAKEFILRTLGDFKSGKISFV